MQRYLAILLTALFLSTSTACIVHTNDRRGRSHRSVKKGKKKCHPSQRWDGRRCRHKGKGHGARKHDGRR
jgi:hypothetical protein